MKKIAKKHLVCPKCGKSDNVANNKPFSQKRTKRVQKINLQKVGNEILCSTCVKTSKKS